MQADECLRLGRAMSAGGMQDAHAGQCGTTLSGSEVAAYHEQGRNADIIVASRDTVCSTCLALRAFHSASSS